MADLDEIEGEGLGFYEDVYGNLPRPMLLTAPLFPSLTWATRASGHQEMFLKPAPLTTKEKKFLTRAEDLLLLMAPFPCLVEQKERVSKIRLWLSEKEEGALTTCPRSLKEIKLDLAKAFHALEAAKAAKP